MMLTGSFGQSDTGQHLQAKRLRCAPAWWPVLVLLLLVAGAGRTWGQTEQNTADPPKEAVAGEPVEAEVDDQDDLPKVDVGQLPGEVKPDVFLLPDKDGKLQHVLGFTFEKFMAAYKLMKQIDPQEQKPRSSLQRVAITGTAEGSRARLTVELDIDVQDRQWVRLPLRLANAVLQQVEYDGPGQQRLGLEDNGEGYVSWVRGEPGKVHRLKLEVLVPLTALGGETQLRLVLPRAAITEMQLSVPLEHLVARVTEGTMLLADEESAAGKTMLTLSGVGGDFTLAWRAAESQVAEVPTVLEASGALLVRIDGRSVNTEASILVRSFGGQFDQFRVRLPPRAELVKTNQSGVQLIPVVTDSDPEANPDLGKLVDVKLEKKTAGPVEIRLVTERPHNIAEAEEFLELAGFEVLGAVRQWGNIAIRVVGNWQLVWGESHNIRQVEDLPEPLRSEELLAGFEYYVQPYSLMARVVPQKTRVQVQPEYTFLVGAQEIELNAHLKYTIRGAKVRTVSIDLPGWEIDEVGPSNLVNVDSAIGNDSSTFTIPLAQPTSGSLELTLQARRAVSEGANLLELEMPRPHAESVVHATVVVVPADNVELSPQPDATANLTAQAIRPQVKLPERQQDPLLFRTESYPAKFVAGFKVNSQVITSDVVSQVDLDEQEIRIDQRLTYQVNYEPIDKLMLRVPLSISPERLRVTLDGQKLTPVAIREEAKSENDEIATMRVALPAARIGRCELQVSYLLSQEKLPPSTSVPMSIPLVMPADGKLASNRLFVAAKTGIALSPRKGSWTADASSRPGRPGSLVLSSQGPASEVSLAVTIKDRQQEGSTIVERGWIQTWLSGRARQDRAVYRFTTNEQQLRIELPANAVLPAVQVMLDGSRLQPQINASRELAIPLGVASDQREHLLELQYHFPEQERGGQLAFDCPQFKPAVWVRQLYWQVVLPRGEHLLNRPPHFTNESSWTWNGLFWHRQPVLEQSELERWVGVTTSGRLPVDSNRYLFSTAGSCDTLELWMVRRSVLVLFASLTVLGMGLMLIYIPATRHPGLLFCLAVISLAASLIQPEVMLLITQAASLGLVLTLVAVYLRRLAFRQPIVTAVRHSSHADRSATEMYYRGGKTGSHPSTATAPMTVQSSSSESKS